MRILLMLCCAASMGGCAAPHAVRVRCDGRLVPINAAYSPAAGSASKATGISPRSPAP